MKKIIITVLVLINVNTAFAAMSNAEVDSLISDKYNDIKSNERLSIPKYSGDVLTFKRLSTIKNIFSFNHELPFKEKKKISEGNIADNSNSYKIPDELGLLMSRPKSEYQGYPLTKFKFNGAVFQDDEEWAIIVLPDMVAPVYIREGDVIGDNYGTVTKVTKDGMIVSEWKKDPATNAWSKVETLVE